MLAKGLHQVRDLVATYRAERIRYHDRQLKAPDLSGIGLQVHEAPSLAPGQPGIISADMCVTVEPGVYLPGRGGVRIEDSGVVRSGSSDPDSTGPGYQVLTLTSRDLVVL